MSITIRSEAFEDGQPVPARYTGEGANISPPLSWTGVPAQAKELAIIMDDPDAPKGTFVHWVIYKIPAGVARLQEGVKPSPRPPEPAGALQGANSFGSTGYGGPMPPKGGGVHHYHFKIYALDKELDLQQGLTKEQLLEAMKGSILAEGRLIGTYVRE